MSYLRYPASLSHRRPHTPHILSSPHIDGALMQGAETGTWGLASVSQWDKGLVLRLSTRQVPLGFHF